MNRATLDIIERSQFILCLDPPHPGVESRSPVTVKQLEIMSNNILHGNGSTMCSCNRWFDHAIQVLVNLVLSLLSLNQYFTIPVIVSYRN